MQIGTNTLEELAPSIFKVQEELAEARKDRHWDGRTGALGKPMGDSGLNTPKDHHL
jgi:hypothetical protein